MADDEVQTGGMIALVPDKPGDFTVPGGDPAGEMHCTLVYLGDDVTGLPDEIAQALKTACTQIALGCAPIGAGILGPAIWNRDGGPDGKFKPATVTTLQSGTDYSDPNSQVPFLQQRVADMAREVLGDALYPEQHSPFLPHITSGYSLPEDVLPGAKGNVKFTAIRLALGGQSFLYPLTATPGDDTRNYAAKEATTMAEEKADTEPARVPLYFPCLAVEGKATADGRFIEPGSLTTRALPISVLAQTVNPGSEGGHAKAEIIGNLSEVWRIPGPEFISKQTGEPLPEGTFVWQGRGSADPELAGTKLVKNGDLTGNSIDLSEVDFSDEVTYAEDGSESHQTNVTKGVIAATTLCAIPAFPDAYVEVDGASITPSTVALAASAAPAFRASELGDDCMPCSAELAGFKPFVKGGTVAITDAASLAKAISGVSELKGPAADKAKARIVTAAKKLKLEAKVPKGWMPVTAASAPELPPLEWFTDPGLSEPTPLQVDAETGRVFGHIATWGTCHIGISKRCTPPPKSGSDYAYFNTGAKRALDGEQVRTVAVGHLTMNTGHAELSASADETVRHYDHTGTQVADVAAGEDEHGIWVAGTLTPGLSDADLNRLLASPPSGDWRPMGGHLEMVAVLAVNTPGYPVPRARVASVGGEDPEMVALVAAGALKPAADFSGGIDLDELSTRVAAKLADLLGDWSRSPKGDPDTLGVTISASAMDLERIALAAELNSPFRSAR